MHGYCVKSCFENKLKDNRLRFHKMFKIMYILIAIIIIHIGIPYTIIHINIYLIYIIHTIPLNLNYCNVPYHSFVNRYIFRIINKFTLLLAVIQLGFKVGYILLILSKNKQENIKFNMLLNSKFYTHIFFLCK